MRDQRAGVFFLRTTAEDTPLNQSDLTFAEQVIRAAVQAPEPEAPAGAPKDLIAAVWEPFVGFLSRPRALEILGFVVLYNLSDNLAGALTSPFLIERGYPLIEVGLASGTVGWWATVVGAFIGGFVTQITNEKLTEFFDKNPSVMKKIIGKALEAARA